MQGAKKLSAVQLTPGDQNGRNHCADAWSMYGVPQLLRYASQAEAFTGPRDNSTKSSLILSRPQPPRLAVHAMHMECRAKPQVAVVQAGGVGPREAESSNIQGIATPLPTSMIPSARGGDRLRRMEPRSSTLASALSCWLIASES